MLLETEGHLDLGDLIALSRKKKIGETTVYRALKTLQKAGLVNRIDNGNGKVAYEIPHKHHDHMICTGCGKILEFHSSTIEKIQEQIAEKHRFNIQYHHHEIYGLCDFCLKTNRREI